MNIAFNINTFGLAGLAATTTSLIRNCSDTEELKLYFLCSEVAKEDKNSIERLLKDEDYKGLFYFIDFDAKKIFGHLTSLHGDWTTYGRLLIPSLINEDSVLYLDADLLVLVDILELKAFDFQNKIVAGVYGAPIAYVLDKSFFIDKLDWDTETGYFNAGVVLFNSKKWRAENFDEKINYLTSTYGDFLINNDQTLLNAISEGDFAHLDIKFNIPWYPVGERPSDSSNGIIHLLGAPKPWDFLGKALNYAYPVWLSYTPTWWRLKYCGVSKDKLIKAWHTRRSLYKYIVKKLKK